MALPEDHLAKFYKMTDAKYIWEAIKSRLGGNDEYKKMQEEPKAMVTVDGESVDWTAHAEDEQEDFAFMAYGNSSSDSEVISCSSAEHCVENNANLKKLLCMKQRELSDASIEIKGIFSRFVTSDGMHAVPPPMTGNYMPSGPDVEIDDSKFTYGPKQPITSESETNTSDFSSCESEFLRVESLNPVLTRTGRILVNTARPSSTNKVSTARQNSSQAVLTSAARKVNTVRPKMNDNRPKTVFHKVHSPFRRPFNRPTTSKANTVKASASWVWKPKHEELNHVFKSNSAFKT
ncbi:hypothetical protein Tco_1065762 [Tanacetum coccineum]